MREEYNNRPSTVPPPAAEEWVRAWCEGQWAALLGEECKESRPGGAVGDPLLCRNDPLPMAAAKAKSEVEANAVWRETISHLS